MHTTRTLAISACLALACAAQAQPQTQNWPEKPIKLIAPSAAGGPPDLYARALADQLGKELGQAVVVENVPAAGGMIAAQQMMRNAADGYTLLVNTAGMMTITPNANPRAQYRIADFTTLCQGVDAGLVLVGSPSLGAHNFNELKTWLKAQKAPPTYSSYSPGSPAHFLGYQLAEALGLEMTHVPYRSSPQQITDMLGATAPLGFAQISTAGPHIKSGKLVAFLTTGAQRSAQLPEVPTVVEVGLPQLETSTWMGLSAPKGLPATVAERLTRAHQKIVATPEFRTRMDASGLSAAPKVCGENFVRKMGTESERWTRVIKATGFVAD